MRELLAAQQSSSAFADTGDVVIAREAGHTEATRHAGTGKTKRATVLGGLLDDFIPAPLPNRAERWEVAVTLIWCPRRDSNPQPFP